MLDKYKIVRLRQRGVLRSYEKLKNYSNAQISISPTEKDLGSQKYMYICEHERVW